MIAHTTINDLLENKKSLYFTVALSILYVLPLLIANVYYQDDHARAMYAHGWSHDGRFINNWINKLITLSNFKFSLYPVTLILSALLLGLSGYVLCGLWKVEYTKNLKWSSLLLLISPFYLANLPYRYDALFMSLSIFVLIIPYVYFYKKKHFLLISILCFYLSLGMYEPSVSIYLMVGVVFIYQFLEKNDFRKAFIYIGLMIIACLVGYLFYHFTKLGLNINAHNERIQLVFFQPNYQFLIKEKLLMFYENEAAAITEIFITNKDLNEEITKENFWDCIDLSVTEEQVDFVTSNAVSIAQSKIQPECIPLVVYDDDLMVGFIMYCIDEDDGEYWIYRMMIDRKYQSKGYGKKALSKLLEIIKEDKNHDKVFLGVHKESSYAIKLYKSFGFEFNGQVFGKEHIMRLDY